MGSPYANSNSTLQLALVNCNTWPDGISLESSQSTGMPLSGKAPPSAIWSVQAGN